MQGQYGQPGDKKLRVAVNEMWTEWGFRKGIMRGYWVTVAREIPAYAGCVSLTVVFTFTPCSTLPRSDSTQVGTTSRHCGQYFDVVHRIRVL